MSRISKPTIPHHQPVRRFWKVVSRSKGWWIWLPLSIVISGTIHLWLLQRMHSVSSSQLVGTGPMSAFSWTSLALLIVVILYTLHRHSLQGFSDQAQDWLWMHLTVGTFAVLVAMLHANYDRVLSTTSLSVSHLLSGNASPLWGYLIYTLAMSGLVCRLLHYWSARVMIREAKTNGIGIPEAIELHLEELEITIERLAAGKSANFYIYSQQALGKISLLAQHIPTIASGEMAEFGQVRKLLKERTQLLISLRRQHQAKTFMQWGQMIHVVLTLLTVLIVCLHVGIATNIEPLRQ